MSKNKSDSKWGVLPRVGVWSLGSKIFRRSVIALGTRSARACGGAWARVAACLWSVLRSSCRHERVGFRGSQFGRRLTIERISPIGRYPGSIGWGRWMVSKIIYVQLGIFRIVEEFTDRESEPRMFRFNNLKFMFYINRAMVSDLTVRSGPNFQDRCPIPRRT